MVTRWIERILVRDLEAMKREIAAFPTEQSVWTTPPGIANSAGTLALHVAGNLRHFVGGRLGGSDYLRDRAHEFAARHLPRAVLLGELDAAAAAVTTALGSGSPIDLTAAFGEPVGGCRVTTGDFLIHLATHLAFHLGQVGYLRRIVAESTTSVCSVSIPELASAVKLPPTSA